jgi:hypothetical protein
MFTRLDIPLVPQNNTLDVQNISLSSSLSPVRNKVAADTLKVSAIKAYPALSGEILINQ